VDVNGSPASNSHAPSPAERRADGGEAGRFGARRPCPCPLLFPQCLKPDSRKDIVRSMELIVELDGPIVDVRPRYYEAHRRVQGELGLASRNADEFWRLVRKGAPPVEVVRPHRFGQVDEYVRLFAARVTMEDLLALDRPQPDASAAMVGLSDIAICKLVVLRGDRNAAQRLLDQYELWRFFRTLRLLSQDRARRIAQLSELTERGAQAIVAAGTDALARSAREAGFLVVGVGNGCCTPMRLRQAGADALVKDLSELLEIIRRPTDEILRAGYQPA
jgi:phosphoglycolate phosphatase-like HAD superfamily hydrolase